MALTHWGRVTHICVSELTIIVSDNGLSPGRRQAIIWTNAGILSIGPYGTNFSEILIEIITFSFTKMSLKVSSAKWRPLCLGLNELTHWGLVTTYSIMNLVSIGSSKIMANITKPLPESMLTNHQGGIVSPGSSFTRYSQDIYLHSIRVNMSLNIANSRLLWAAPLRGQWDDSHCQHIEAWTEWSTFHGWHF